MKEALLSHPVTHNNPDFSVSQLSKLLKQTVERGFDNVRVRGEVSGYKRHSSGHLYFTLKDDEAVLDAVCWRGSVPRLTISPEDGMEVIATGRLTTYPGRSKYQMVVEQMELAGQGAMLKLLEDRKRKLASEGLFDSDRKKKLPFIPAVIGVVTSPTGAVIKDILHRLSDRFPSHVLLWSVAVQGEQAASQIAAAIDGFNQLPENGQIPRPEVLIVARGGGALEDLWAFNEEIVVRAAARSMIPLISAVGHESDTTLIDYAADLRAPTPTAAAEMAVPVRRDLILQVMDRERRLVSALDRMIVEKTSRLASLSRGLPDLSRKIQDMARSLDDKIDRLENALRNTIPNRRLILTSLTARLVPAIRSWHNGETRRLEQTTKFLRSLSERLVAGKNRLLTDRQNKLAQYGALLESFSYEQVLKRGFVLVRNASGEPLTSADNAQTGDRWTLTFQNNKDVGVEVS